MKIKITFFSTVLIFLLNINIFAENLSGIVNTPDGMPLKGVSVTVLPGGITSETDSSGFFLIQNLQSGRYILDISSNALGYEDVLIKADVPYKGDLVISLKERSYRADEVVIISKRPEDSNINKNVPSSVTFIKRSEFAEKADTVSDVLKHAPGVNVSALGGLGDFSEISLRGAGANQVQIYLDGILLNEASGGSVNLSTISLSNVESIEVWRSGAPAEFGGNAAGGVVSIKTRETLKSHSFSLGYGSFGTMVGSLSANVPIKSSYLVLNGDYSSSKNNFNFISNNGTRYNKKDDYSATRKNDNYESLNFTGKFKHLFSEKTLLEISNNFLDSSKSLPGQDIVQDSKADLETVRNLFQTRITNSAFFTEKLEFSPLIQQIHKREHYRDPDGGIGWGNQDNLYVTNSYIFKAPLIYEVSSRLKIHLTPVYNIELYRPDHKLQVTEPLSCDRTHIGFAADGDYTLPGDRFSLRANITRDRFFSSYDGQPSPQNRVTPESRNDYFTSWNSGLKLSVTKNFWFKANIGDASRVPSFFELFGDRGYTLSKPELKHEQVRRYDVGVTFNLKTEKIPIVFSLESIYFRNSNKNLIQWYANDAGFLYADNVGESYVRGTEVILNGNLLKRLNFTGNWTFQDSKVTKELRVYNENKKLPNRPDEYGSVMIEYPNKYFTPYWSVNHKGEYYLDRSNQEDKLYPGRTFHDIGITLSPDNQKTMLTFTIKNLNDVRTYDTLWMPLPGRSYSFRVTKNF